VLIDVRSERFATANALTAQAVIADHRANGVPVHPERIGGTVDV